MTPRSFSPQETKDLVTHWQQQYEESGLSRTFTDEFGNVMPIFTFEEYLAMQLDGARREADHADLVLGGVRQAVVLLCQLTGMEVPSAE